MPHGQFVSNSTCVIKKLQAHKILAVFPHLSKLPTCVHGKRVKKCLHIDTLLNACIYACIYHERCARFGWNTEQFTQNDSNRKWNAEHTSLNGSLV
jgi:hypothetical protein